ncbi:alpha-protein kinase 3-like isoform X2 [Phycodurus eques]|nr:alpha-protein kinase 3-like isoform X2 [Phycodurus eques]
MGHRCIDWFRKGLRLHDNPALMAALTDCKELYLPSSWIHISTTRHRLFVMRGKPEDIFPQLFSNWKITKLTYDFDTGPYSVSRDQKVAALAKEHSVEVLYKVSHTLYDIDRTFAYFQMGSRRTTSRSQSANGRAGQGNGIVGNSRPGGCSYISNVRPENRSTLCSVIAQLTQETQPTFVTTLKSRAVSENCNVKFFCVVTGYPIPQLTWYKDDKQLDRFCGLPKYEIFRNGQNHSLHIYDCTLEDAAIYQASASNSKGIVSCSGVLEVGGMNEYKIHQRYFAKLKQKAEGRGKEADGKENQVPFRTISPERSQRKRRSTMEAFLRAPSSTENKVTEELIPSVGEDSKVRLEEPAEELVEERPTPLTKTSAKTNNESGVGGGIAKTPFVKKKIKICPRDERTPEEMRQASAEELMEVERCRKMAEHQNRAPFGKLSRKKSSEALRSPEGVRKDKESNRKRDEKVFEKNPRMSTRLPSAPETQRPSSRVMQHMADSGAVDGILQSRAALPEQTSDQSPQQETKVRQRNTSVHCEVTQAPTWMSGNNAPVNPEPPPDQRLAVAIARPQRKPPLKQAATREDAQPFFVTPHESSLYRQHHSKGSRQNHMAPQKSELVSSADKQSQAGLVVKSVGGQEVHPNKKVDDSDVRKAVVPNEKIVKRLTVTPVTPKVQQPEHTSDKVPTVTNPIVVSNNGKKEFSLKANSQFQTNKQTKVETACPHSQKTLSLNEQQYRNIQETSKPVSRVISVAELMRAQIMALDSAELSPTKDIPIDLAACPAAADKSQNLGNDQGKSTAQGGKSAPDDIPKNSVGRTSPKEHLVQQNHLGKNKTSEKNLSPCLSSVIDPLSIECNRDVTAFPNAGSSNNFTFVPVNPKEEATQGRKSAPDSIAKNHVGQTSPKEHLKKQSHLRKNSTFQENPSPCPSCVIDPLGTQYSQDVTDIPHAGSSNTYPSVPVNPKEEATTGRKSVPVGIPKNHVDLISQEKTLVNQSQMGKNRTLQEDLHLCPSSVVDPLSTQCSQDVTDIPRVGPSNNYPSVAVNTKEEAPPGRKSVPVGIPKSHIDQISLNETLVNQSHLGKNKTFQEYPRPCPSAVIDPFSIECHGDVTEIAHAGYLNNYTSGPMHPEEKATQGRKSVPDSMPKNCIQQTSPKEQLIKQSQTFQEDTRPCPSSVVVSLSLECNRDLKAIPLAGSQNYYPSVPVIPKEEVIQRHTSRTKTVWTQGKNLGQVEKFLPDIKFNTETQHGTTGNISQTLQVEHNLTNSSLEVLRLPSVLRADTQENTLCFQGQSMVEDIQGNNILPNSSPEATLLPNSSPEATPLIQKRDFDSYLSSATPRELASGARPKILSSKDKPEETKLPPYPHPEKQEVSPPDSTLSTSPLSILSSPKCSRQSPPLLQPNDERNSPVEKRSSIVGRKKITAVTKASSQPPDENIQSEKSEKDRWDPCKAPQVIRKIRSESFPDASGHLKLWCQFFNILTDSTIAWYRNQLEIAQIKRSAADESQVNLAVIQASSKDSGVYKCTITNDYGSDSTDFLLGPDTLSGISLREDHGVGEEIEMAPLMFSKGVADSSVWGNKLFGRVMVHKCCISEGCAHKVWRAKVIYGLEPVFESGHTCIIKAQRHIAYGGKEEHCLTDRNLDFVKENCKIQNLARAYCKIFSAETRVTENFGPPLEVIPVYLMYRPANTIPYATVEADLVGVYQKYVVIDHMGRIEMRMASEVELKCCALQHWIFQWTHGNLLITRLEGVDTKITNIGITVKSTGHQGLQMEGKPEVLEGFVSQHQCNYFCGLLGLRSLKLLDSLTAPAKTKGSRSPSLQRKSQASGSCSPQTSRRAANSPRVPRKAEQDATKNLKDAVEVSL